ncbi:transmembrane protein, putative [Medicago truncatula]|uniref:Transmembrane protein, putative n=1 Tax=Medicago truncatula TaxID=3880 RepID=G7K660_MEDTR|nr:transmembrane protein, putative [Medicago truncatula]
MVVALLGSSWDCLGEVWISGVGTDCVRELYKGVTGVVLGEEAGVGWGDFLWKQPLLHGSMFVVTSSCLCFLGGLGVYGVWRMRVPFLFAGFSVGRFIWLRDRESESSCNLCLTCFGNSLLYRGRGVLCYFGSKVWWTDPF